MVYIYYYYCYAVLTIKAHVGFDRAETNCGIARILGITDERLRQLDIYKSRTSDRGLSTLNIIVARQLIDS